MKKYFVSAVLISVMAFLLAGLGFALLRKQLESSEVAAWVQAIGSIAAIGGAVLIYQSQERQRRHTEMAAAKITAANMIHRVILVQAEIKACSDWLSEVAQFDGPHLGFKAHCDRLDALPKWTQEELIRLAPLDRDCGLKLSAALDMVGSGRELCRIAIIDPRAPIDSEVRKRYGATAAKQFNLAQKALSYVLTDLRAVTNGVIE